jgi:carbon-monoxide dehydrogenase medium subunit
MKAPKFDYARPDTLAEALDLLADRTDAKVLAGGQSLVPALNLRLLVPECVVDINRIVEFSPIERRGEVVALGALVRHADVARSDLIARATPLIAQAIRYVAHPAIRNRGTTCGSIAYADPAAEMPACAVALDATFVLRSKSRQREVRARDFFRGIYETARCDDEILVEVRFPIARDEEVFGFDEIARRRGDFALVGVAARARSDGTVMRDLDLVLFGSEPRPLLSVAARAPAEGRRWTPVVVAEIAEAASNDMDPLGNLQGRADTKRHQARVVIERVLTRMMEKDLARRR